MSIMTRVQRVLGGEIMGVGDEMPFFLISLLIQSSWHDSSIVEENEARFALCGGILIYLLYRPSGLWSVASLLIVVMRVMTGS